MKKKLAVIGIIVAVVLSLGSFLLYHFMTGPMYKSGQVRAGLSLTEALEPPEQPLGDFYDMGGGIRLRKYVSGEGPAAIVVHGGPGFPPDGSWPGLDLLGTHTFTYFHQRGCGESTRPFETLEGGFIEKLKTLEHKLGLGAQIADIERIRRILGEERILLVGHSFGGFIAALYAAEFPEHVTAMILVAPATIVKMPSEHSDGFFKAIRAHLPDERHAAFDAWLERYMDMGAVLDQSETELAALTRGFGTFWKEAATASGVAFPAELEIDTNGGFMGFAMFFSMGMRHDYTPHLAHVTAPVLVVHGEKDFQTEAASRRYVDYFPNAEFAVVKGVGHFPFIEAPREFSDAVRPFLERL